MFFREVLSVAFSVSVFFRCLQEGEFCNDVHLFATPSVKNISSPNYPQDYPNNASCVTHIISPEGTVIELHFNSFNLQESEYCSKDSLVVHDGMDSDEILLQHSCGSDFLWPHYPDKVVSSDNEMTITFRSDASVTSSGFFATYKSVQPSPKIFVLAHKENDLVVLPRHSAVMDRISPEGVETILSVDYDPIEQYIYFSDNGTKTIQKLHRIRKITTILYSDGIENPVGLRLDIIARLIYWTDETLGTLSVSDLEGTRRSTLISTNLERPGAIVIESSRGFIYYIDAGSTPKIERSEGDGSHRTVLVDTDLSFPTGLAIDLDERVLYWTDSMLRILERVYVDGSARSILKLSLKVSPFSMVLDENAFFMTNGDPSRGSIFFIDRHVATIGHIIHIRNITLPFRGATLRPLYDFGDNVSYSCPSSECIGLCLPKVMGKYKCIKDKISCPEDIEDEVTEVIKQTRIFWQEPVDGEGNPPFNSSHSSGDVFPLGQTHVTYWFSQFGVPSTCTFKVDVLENTVSTDNSMQEPCFALRIVIPIVGALFVVGLLVGLLIGLFCWKVLAKQVPATTGRRRDESIDGQSNHSYYDRDIPLNERKVPNAESASTCGCCSQPEHEQDDYMDMDENIAKA